MLRDAYKEAVECGQGGWKPVKLGVKHYPDPDIMQ